jgi:hypothetical protein
MASRLVNPLTINVLYAHPSPLLPNLCGRRGCHFEGMSSFRSPFHTSLLLSSPSKRTMNLSNPSKRPISLASRRNPAFRPLRRLEPRHYSTQGLLESIMEAVEAMRLTRKQLRPTGRYLFSAQFSLNALVIAENSRRTLHRASKFAGSGQIIINLT